MDWGRLEGAVPGQGGAGLLVVAVHRESGRSKWGLQPTACRDEEGSAPVDRRAAGVHERSGRGDLGRLEHHGSRRVLGGVGGQMRSPCSSRSPSPEARELSDAPGAHFDGANEARGESATAERASGRKRRPVLLEWCLAEWDCCGNAELSIVRTAPDRSCQEGVGARCWCARIGQV